MLIQIDCTTISRLVLIMALVSDGAHLIRTLLDIFCNNVVFTHVYVINNVRLSTKYVYQFVIFALISFSIDHLKGNSTDII